ncbi:MULTISPECIES: hypothetical protein [unclassified Brevundimonas]|uniref:hypothetical protein n=1 Tax=unclassified Brevundimonas TaxID=2622653 RepID=UPI003F917F21
MSLASTPAAPCRWTPEKAESSHPRTPMAPHLVAALPALRSKDPLRPNRDRFVLSDAHASMLVGGSAD